MRKVSAIVVTIFGLTILACIPQSSSGISMPERTRPLSRRMDMEEGSGGCGKQAISRGRITGRVLLDGKPVRFYGVSMTPNASLPLLESAQVVRSHHGKFVLSVSEERTVDIVLAGPGIARKVLLGQHLTPCTGSLGDVHVARGREITGRVVDAKGQPVAAADVVIRNNGVSLEGPDSLTEIANGIIRTTSNSDGKYSLRGISPGGGQILVERGDFSSGDLTVSEEKSVDVVLYPVGSAHGTISFWESSLVGSSIIAQSVSNPKMTVMATVDETGKFFFDKLPEGTYQVFLVERASIVKQLVVRATTDVAIVL